MLRDLQNNRRAFLTLTMEAALPPNMLLLCLTLGVLEVVSPKGTDLVLAAHVPHGEADVLVFHRLYIEA